MEVKDLVKIVRDLNENLSIDAEHSFCFTTNGDVYVIQYDVVYLWDSENISSDEDIRNFVQDAFDRYVLNALCPFSKRAELEEKLSGLYTDFCMLEEGQWIPERKSINDSRTTVEELADILDLTIKDTRYESS